MPPGATTVQVNVKSVWSDGTTTVCQLNPKRQSDQPYVNGGIIQLPPAGAPYEVEFHLDPTSPVSVSFDSSNGWSCKMGGCPAPNDHSPQFGHAHVDSSGKVLTVNSPPLAGNKVALYYSLNFADQSRFDPIIIKG